MRQFLIGLGTLYASVFAFPRWGWEAVGVLFASALLLNYSLKHLGKSKARHREDQRKAHQAQREAAKLEEFKKAGNWFLCLGRSIVKFDHRLDAILNFRASLGGLRPVDCNIALGFDGCYVILFNPSGWPNGSDETVARDILRILTSPSYDRVPYQWLQIPASHVALRDDERKRGEALAKIEARVAARASLLASRTALDMGPDSIAVYIIAAAGRRTSKIGVSKQPNRRRSGLQTGNPNALSVYREFWMSRRSDANLLEREVHQMLRSDGVSESGEWFSVEPEVAALRVVAAFDALLERRLLVESPAVATEQSTDREILAALADHIPWGLSKRRNLVASILGKRMTVYLRRGEWWFVIDGQFSNRGYATPLAAQLECLATLSLCRDQALGLLAETPTEDIS